MKSIILKGCYSGSYCQYTPVSHYNKYFTTGEYVKSISFRIIKYECISKR